MLRLSDSDINLIQEDILSINSYGYENVNSKRDLHEHIHDISKDMPTNENCYEEYRQALIDTLAASSILNLTFMLIDSTNLEYFAPIIYQPWNIFSSKALVIGVAYDEIPCGVIQANVTDKGVVIIDWLYVIEKFRRRGIGNLLIGTLIQSAAMTGIDTFITGHAYMSFTTMLFLKQIGFVMDSYNKNYIVKLDNLEAIYKFRSSIPDINTEGSFKPLSECDLDEIEKVKVLLSNLGHDNRIVYKSEIDQGLSIVYKNLDDEVVAMLLCGTYGDTLVIESLCASKGNEIIILMLIRKLCIYLLKNHKNYNNLALHATNSKIESFISRVLGSKAVLDEAGKIGILHI